MEVLDGILTRINFHKASRFSLSGEMYLIGTIHNGVTVKGNMDKPRLNENYRFWGEWRESKDKRYPAPSFEFAHHEPIIDKSEAGQAQFLADHIDGLGKVKSAALVAAFGADTLDILRADPDKALAVQGITPPVADAIRDYFDSNPLIDPNAYARLVDMFAEHRVPKKVVIKLLKDHKSNAPDLVRRNPYMLLAYPRMGWETVDAIGTTTAGYSAKGSHRHAAAIVEALTRHTLDGHTHATRLDMEEIAFRLLGMRPSDEGWAEALGGSPRRVTEAADTYSPPKLWAAETLIAERLTTLMATAKPLDFDLDTDGLQGEQVAAVGVIQENGVAILAGAPGTGKSYTTAKVVDSLLSHGMSGVRVACPTGKAAKRAAELLAAHGIDGTQVPSTTIHRMLAPIPGDDDDAGPGASQDNAKHGRGKDSFRFAHNADHPLEVEYLVLDECSMIDAELMASTLDAVPNGTRILFVGDPNQLPSVGPGSVLRDMMGLVPTVYLTEIRRSQPGRVIEACHAILKGKVPQPAERVMLDAGENWVHIEIDDPNEIARQIVDLHQTGKRFTDAYWDFQVVTPQKARLPIACENLNRMLSAKLNDEPDPYAAQGGGQGDGNDSSGDGGNGEQESAPRRDFRKGDKVIRTKNGICDLMVPLPPPQAPPMPETCDEQGFDWAAGKHYLEDWNPLDFEADDLDSAHADWHWRGQSYTFKETDVVNGDMGRVLDIVTEPKDIYVVVQFRDPERVCRLKYGKCELVAAYAVTCHRAQGSGFPYVIVPVHSSFYWDTRNDKGLFSKEWTYTALSRAEQLLVTVGTFDSIRRAVGRRTIHKRQTRLSGMLRERLNQRSGPPSSPVPSLPSNGRRKTELSEVRA